MQRAIPVRLGRQSCLTSNDDTAEQSGVTLSSELCRGWDGEAVERRGVVETCCRESRLSGFELQDRKRIRAERM